MMYHCQDPDKRMGMALCGVDVPKFPFKSTYDYPEDYFSNYGYSRKVKRCPACMAHPDVPLLMLGALP